MNESSEDMQDKKKAFSDFIRDTSTPLSEPEPNMTTFEIHYEDPETLEYETHTGEYADLEDACGHAYALADKGHYKIYEIHPTKGYKTKRKLPKW